MGDILPVYNMAQEPTYIDNIEFRFGVEIEICIRIQDGCIENKGIPLSEVGFYDKFKMYFDSILSKASPALKKRFPRIAMKNEDTQFFLYELLNKREIFVEKGTREEQSIESYEVPRFEIDLSVRCGDSLDPDSKIVNRNTGEKVESYKSIAIECISPIFSFKGVPTHEKIKEALLPYLEFIGLLKQECFMTNVSAGYHVNVSAYDLKRKEIIPLTKYPLLLFVLDEYIKKEREYYASEFRVNASAFAKPIYKMTNLLLEQRPELRNNKRAFFKALTDPEHLVMFKAGSNDDRVTFPRDSWITRKKFGIKVKPMEILEFRVFRSEKDIELLIDNAMYSLVIVMNAIMNMWTKRSPVSGLANVNSLFEGGRRKTRRSRNN
jgi:hypothetical protein